MDYETLERAFESIDLNTGRDFSDYTYSVIRDGVDNRLEIIQNDQTGYYNATKTIHIIKRLTGKSKKKQVYNWMANEQAKRYIKYVAQNNNIPEESCTFIINSGKEAFQGTYLHKRLYYHFLMWFAEESSSKVADILDVHTNKVNAKLREVISEKENVIRSQNNDIFKKSEENHSLRQIIFEHANMNKQMLEAMLELKQSNKELHEKSDYLQGTVNVVNAKADVLVTNLVKTAYRSSVSPNNPKKEPYVCIFKKNDHKGGINIQMASRQQKAMIAYREKEFAAGKEEVIPTFYIANGINYRNRVSEKLNTLFKEAKARSTSKPPKTGKYALKVKFNANKIYWHPQPYISFQTIIDVINETIAESQVPDLD